MNSSEQKYRLELYYVKIWLEIWHRFRTMSRNPDVYEVTAEVIGSTINYFHAPWIYDLHARLLWCQILRSWGQG